MNKKLLLIAALTAAVIASVIWWRGRPVKRAERMLTKAAATASVTVDDGDITRRMKFAKLRNYTGYELHVDVEGIADSCDLMQDEALSAWAYAVGRTRYLSVKIMDMEVIPAEEDKMVVNADIRVDSNYQKGRYSKTYPVVMELMTVESKLRVISLKTQL